MILHFPCTNRDASMEERYGLMHPYHPFQRKLSDYCTGLSFADMVEYQMYMHDRAVLAQNADWAGDLSYPGRVVDVTAVDAPECIRECNTMMKMVIG